MSRIQSHGQADPASGTTQEVNVSTAAAFSATTLEVSNVVVEQTNAADANWNIQINGDDLFSAEQSVASGDTPENFVPDQNRHVADETATVSVDVSSAGSAGDLNVFVVFEDHREH
jgi:hypothetical protein